MKWSQKFRFIRVSKNKNRTAVLRSFIIVIIQYTGTYALTFLGLFIYLFLAAWLGGRILDACNSEQVIWLLIKPLVMVSKKCTFGGYTLTSPWAKKNKNVHLWCNPLALSEISWYWGYFHVLSWPLESTSM